MTHIMQNNKITTNNGTGSTLVAPSVAPTSVFNNKKSLNREARKRELLKITMEN